MEFAMTITGQETLTAALRSTLQAASAAALESAAASLRSAVAQQFLTEGRAYETPWLPRRSRHADLSYRPLLFRTGRLLGSLTDPDDPEHVEEISPRESGEDAARPVLTLGSRVPYAAAHQWGTSRLPARPLLTAAMLG